MREAVIADRERGNSTVEFTIGVDEAGGADGMPDLWRRFAQSAAPGCHFELRSGEPVPDTLGGLPEILAQLAPEAIAGCAAIVIAWLRERSSDVEVTITRPDGEEITVRAERCDHMDAATLASLMAQHRSEHTPE
ncbi:hypothetical protein ABZ471_25980 [Streptomyces sp. NPDC005728]|uniref:effector-associated constant component EACC1 n=1 Tax=Streptomyces sp. NPDC005728 TaxID=3157054 RepID=UPI0033EC974E